MLLVVLLIFVELVLLPLFPKLEYFLMNPFKGIGVAFLLHLADVSVNFSIDTVLHITSEENDTSSCSPLEVQTPISYVIYTLPVALSHTSLLLLYIYIFEFVCSQSPCNMIGLITGIFFAFPSLLNGIGYAVEYLLFDFDALSFGGLSCTFWILLLQLISSSIGFIIYVIVAKWRQRAMDPNIHAMIEEKYESYLKYTENETKREVEAIIMTI